MRFRATMGGRSLQILCKFRATFCQALLPAFCHHKSLPGVIQLRLSQTIRSGVAPSNPLISPDKAIPKPALRGRIRRVRDLAQSVPAQNDVAIAELVVPYRFDILIRRKMIGLLYEPTAMGLEIPEHDLVDMAAESGYADWFDKVEVKRFRTHLRNDASARRWGLLARIEGLQTLIRSMQQNDELTTASLVLDYHLRGATSETGIAAHPLAPAEGCHRIAYMSYRGHHYLTSKSVRKRLRLGQSVLDNTSLLVKSNRFDTDTVLNELADEHPGFQAVLNGSSGTDVREAEFTAWLKMVRNTSGRTR